MKHIINRIDRLPRHPVPISGESMSSWLIRLAQVNVQRLSYITYQLTGNHNFWKSDPDKFLPAEVLLNFQRVTRLPETTMLGLQLGQYVGRLYPQLLARRTGSWVLPLAKRFYENQRHGALFCPECLVEQPGKVSHLRLHWRLSFMVGCKEHGTLLRDSCPHCGAPFAPHLNDLGRGRNWNPVRGSPFGWCASCEGDLRVPTDRVYDGEMAFQGRLLMALEQGHMQWAGLGSVPTLEGFDVLHQLLGLLTQAGVQQAVQTFSGVQGPLEWPERSNRSFEDFNLEGRRALLRQVAYLTSVWPDALIKIAEVTELTRKPMVVNMPSIPPWYDKVAERFSLANGRRPYKHVPLVPHGSRQSLANYRRCAKTESERRRWEVLWHYHATPNATLVAQQLGVRWDFVNRTVQRYNAQGPQGVKESRRGKMNRQRRLLTEEQESELQGLLKASERPPTNEKLAAWFEERIGQRPSETTIWMYRRGVKDHSLIGRRARAR